MFDLRKLEIMNAAGWCKTPDVFEQLCLTPVTQICVGSITIEPRDLPEGDTFWSSNDGTASINSRNLQNMGLVRFLEILPTMALRARACGKKLRVNIAAFSPQELFLLAVSILPYVDVLEINFGCPNVWGPGGQKPIASFNLSLLRESIAALKDAVAATRKTEIAVKLSPYSDPLQFLHTIQFFTSQTDLVSEIVTSNTFPNAFAWENGKPAITPGGGFGGLSGPALRHIALGQAYVLQRELKGTSVKVTLVGGIEEGNHVVDAMRCGIYSVQIGRHWMKEGNRVFSEILSEAVRHPEVVTE